MYRNLGISAIICLMTCGSAFAAGGKHAPTQKKLVPTAVEATPVIVQTPIVPPMVAPFIPKFDISAEAIAAVATESRKILDAQLDTIVKLPNEQRTFENTVFALENALADYSDRANIPQFVGYVSADKIVRDAASAFEEQANSYLVEISTRRDLYEAVKACEPLMPKLSKDDAFLLKRTILDFERSGLKLPTAELAKYKELKQKLVSLELRFDKNIREYKDPLEVAKEDLDGLSPDLVKKLPVASDGKFLVSLDYPTYFPFMDNVKSDEARRCLEFKFNNRCASDNVTIMEEALGLRDQIAKLLGYANHSEYVLSDRMAKRQITVTTFLDRLWTKLYPKARQELRTRLAIREKEAKIPASQEMKLWQWRYYNNRFRKLELDIDKEVVKEYFPSQKVMDELLGIFQEIFDVTMKKSDLPVWHKDVTAYTVCEKNGDVIGYLYLDLFPREGKYKHCACFPLVKGRLLADGTYEKPSAAIVANFTEPTGDKPSLLGHDEVEVLFHEFGHVTHNIFTRAKYASFSGTSVARDFVEVPSTILENWVWNPIILKRISNHYKTGEKLPDDLLNKIVASRNFDAGMTSVRQLFFSKLDLEYHTRQLTQTTEFYKKLQKDVMIIPMSEGTHPQASFGHLMGGYDSGYYGYLWARIISSDLFSEFEKKGLTDPTVGRKYRDLILAKGRTEDPAEQVQEYLGRPFSEDAYIRSLGLKTESKAKP
ncbi:MAG: M3 family metallopeptidase [Candidatus Ozemobacteraceae bacterium]